MRKLGQCHNSNFDRPFLEHDFGGGSGSGGGGRIKLSACLPPFLSQCSSTALCSAVNIMQCCLCFALDHTAQCVVPKG